MTSKPTTIISALLFSLIVPAIGYIYLGWLVAFLFFIGYFGGFIFWLFTRPNASWSSIRIPYFCNLAAFLLLHKVEENRFKFFEVLSDKITGVPVPEVTSLLVIGLLILPIGVWIAMPFLVKRGVSFGYYLVWTFFALMGITELSHFVLPLLTEERYGYFPGMASAAILAPLAWWGICRLLGKSSKQ